MACSQLQRYPKASVKRIGSSPSSYPARAGRAVCKFGDGAGLVHLFSVRSSSAAGSVCICAKKSRSRFNGTDQVSGYAGSIARCITESPPRYLELARPQAYAPAVASRSTIASNISPARLSDTHVSPFHAGTVCTAPSGPALLEVHGTVRYAGATCRSGPKHVEEEGHPRAWLTRHPAEN
ncbi:hypothetical protein B0H14DRAFT_719602 [Mycena olivaceomarginata]|nr:hypothetical protein B0H14DRAFT_719602 [Mycena olivaceomarginata]